MNYKFTFVLLIFSCNQVQRVETERLVALDVVHEECTGCLQATILNKSFQYPDSIKKYLSDTTSRDILLDGENPYLKKGSLSNIFDKADEKKRYKLHGYFSRIDSIDNPVGKVPVFYVVKWESLKRNHK